MDTRRTPTLVEREPISAGGWFKFNFRSVPVALIKANSQVDEGQRQLELRASSSPGLPRTRTNETVRRR